MPLLLSGIDNSRQLLLHSHSTAFELIETRLRQEQVVVQESRGGIDPLNTQLDRAPDTRGCRSAKVALIGFPRQGVPANRLLLVH